MLVRRPESQRVLQKLGLRIVELRCAHDLTQEQLAEIVGLSNRQLQRVEAGAANVNVVTLTLFAAALHCSVSELFLSPSRVIRRRAGRPRLRS